MEIQDFLLPLITLTLSFVIANVTNFTLGKLRKKAEKTETKLDDIILHALGKPLYVLILVAGIYYAIHQTPYLVELMNQKDTNYQYRKFILTIFGTWVIATLAKKIVREYGYEWASKTDSVMDDRLVALADMSGM